MAISYTTAAQTFFKMRIRVIPVVGMRRPDIGSRPAVIMIAAAAITAAVYMGGLDYAEAAAGTYVDSVTFHKQGDRDAITRSIIDGELDMSYLDISRENARDIRDGGHDVYRSVGGTIYGLYVNPADDHTRGFNPFSEQKARFALNYVLDRTHVVENVLSSGSEMYSALTPYSYDYPLVYRYMESFEFDHDLARADSLFRDALEPHGAAKSDGMWRHGGAPVEVTVFIRDDDHVRLAIGERLSDDLGKLGFKVSRTYGDLREAFATVYSTDPADQEWHVYTGAWGNSRESKYDDISLALYYAPWTGSLPGGGEDHVWNYEHDLLDRLTYTLAAGRYSSNEVRAELVYAANHYGVLESVRVFIAIGDELYPVRGDVTGVVNPMGAGIANRYTPINAQLSGGDTNLDIGTRHVAQSSWNPVGGFLDTYSFYAWSLLRDRAHVHDPHDGTIIDSRNMLVSVDTNGPEGRIEIPDGAVAWSVDAHEWAAPGDSHATSRVTFDLKFSNWHHGAPVDINDVLYPLTFNREHTMRHDGDEDIFASDPYAVVSPYIDVTAVNVLDDDTIEVYLDYWNEDDAVIAAVAGLWPAIPWEVYHAMDEAVHEGVSHWYSADARHHGQSWIDMLSEEDSIMARDHLHGHKDANHERHIPEFLYQNRNTEYVNARYDAAISWIDEMNHMAVSNGPFYLDSMERDDSGSITRMTLKQFDDSTYPFEAGTWGSFAATREPLSDVVVVGSLVSETGGADRYGEEIRAASDLAVLHFNEYLEVRGEAWSLGLHPLDTETSPGVALGHLKTLSDSGIKIVDGPAVDIITPEMLAYADDNDMTLVSCCSSVPSNAKPGDALFRMLPDQNTHAREIADVMLHPSESIDRIVPVGIKAPWAEELLDATKSHFERRGGVSDDAIFYETDAGEDMSGAASRLASQVMQAVAQGRASDVAVLYVGFGEGPEFLKAAAQHDVLHKVRWFGADQNTARPNIGDDAVAAAFADAVGFTVVQPTIPATIASRYANSEIQEHLGSLGITPSPYSSYEYSAIWVLGLSMLEARSAESADVREQMHPTAMRYVGTIGSTELNGNGDLADTHYATYQFVADAPPPPPPPPPLSDPGQLQLFSESSSPAWTRYVPPPPICR